MKKQLCFDCIHRVVDIEDAKSVYNSGILQWQCKKGWWQDASICLNCIEGIRDYANRCNSFERIEH
jgi:hypothetical protein